MRLWHQWRRVKAAERRVAKAHERLAVCQEIGHDWDDSVFSPPGMRFCRRCKSRYPVS